MISIMPPCALCSRPLTHPSTRSLVLGASFHADCYDSAWKLKDVRAQQEEGYHVEVRESPMPAHAGREGAGEVVVEGAREPAYN